jgi:hypothetical protein
MAAGHSRRPPSRQNPFFSRGPDAQAELAACALWCGHQLAANPRASSRRHAERGFQPAEARSSAPFSKSITGPAADPRSSSSPSECRSARSRCPKRASVAPLAHRPASRARTRLALLHRLRRRQPAGIFRAASADAQARRRGQEQPQWTLNAFIQSAAIGPDPLPTPPGSTASPEAQRLLAEFARRPQSPLDWAELVPRLLETSGGRSTARCRAPSSRPSAAGSRPSKPAARWASTAAASVAGFPLRLSPHPGRTLFAPSPATRPSRSPAQPSPPASPPMPSGFSAPARTPGRPAARLIPCLPLEVQREAGMPHATPQLDWDLAEAITTRLLASAPEVHFSYARQNEGVEARPSR